VRKKVSEMENMWEKVVVMRGRGGRRRGGGRRGEAMPLI
jgi:hypothetical protein